MVPPPTPSPHRFVATPKPTPKPSNLRFAVPALPRENVPVEPKPPVAYTTPSKPATEQFKQTPRFGAPRFAREAVSQRVQVEVRGERELKRIESIEEGHSQDHSISDEEKGSDFVAQSVEQRPQTIGSGAKGEEEEEEREPIPKRRRLSGSIEALDVPIHAHHMLTPAPSQRPLPPTTPSRTVAARRFVFSTPLANASPAAPPQALFALRTPFLKPPAANTPAAAAVSDAPLPEAFSPHRRGQKFVPGGLASEVRAWVVEASGHGHGRRGEDTAVARVETTSGGLGRVMLVRSVASGNPVNILLASGGKGGVVAKAGDVLSLKAPSWEVELGDELGRWVVGVDWRVLTP